MSPRSSVRSTPALAWRNLAAHPLRTILTALAVAMGVAMTLAAEFASSALLATLVNAGEGDLQVTHGFLVEQFDQTLGLIGYVLIGASAFLAFNAFAMAVSQRQQQLGLLRALGMTRRQIQYLLLVEGLFVGMAGTLLGLLLGPLLGRSIVGLMARLGEEVLTFGAGSIAPRTALLAATLGIGVTVLAALLPARRAGHITPLEALRPLPTDLLTGRVRVPALAGGSAIALLFATLATITPGERLGAPWNASLAALLVLVWLLSLALLLPAALRLAGRLARRLGQRSASGRIIGDNIQRERGRVIVTVLTLAIGLAMITGLTGFMSFAFNDLLGDSMNRMAAAGTWSAFPFDLERGLTGLTQVEELMLSPQTIAAVEEIVAERADVTAFRFALIPELSFLGQSYFTFVVAPETARKHPVLFRFSEGDWETALPLMQAGCAALVTPVVAERNRAGIGEEVTITGRSGPLPCTIAGIGAGYVNASIVSSAVAAEVGATPPIGLLISPRPGAGPLAADLKTLERSQPGLWVTSMADFAELQRETMSLFAVAFNGLLLLAVAAAALGVVNTTMMSIYDRRQELGLLRAVGATRRQVRGVVLGESALIGLLGAIFGVVAGMGSVVIIVTTFGGNSWGVSDLALWPAAGRALQPALLNGLAGIVAAPPLCALAARLPLRSFLRGPAVQGLVALETFY